MLLFGILYKPWYNSALSRHSPMPMISTLATMMPLVGHVMTVQVVSTVAA